MARKVYHQKLPRAGADREALREKGQFWTPAWVAEAMVAYAVGRGGDHVFDPAVGGGAFFAAAKIVGDRLGRDLRLLGTEIDPNVLDQARENGLTQRDLKHVQLRDFVLHPPTGRFEAIVANPPYIRHHRLGAETKAQLRALGTSLIGSPLDGRAGYHIFFLLRALQLLASGGCLAFIMPADTCEGIFSNKLWRWIASRYQLEAVVTFAPDASPFPGVDTNPIIFMIRNASPCADFLWARCTEGRTPDLKQWALAGLKPISSDRITATRRALPEGLATGLSRPPGGGLSLGPALSDFAKVMRGIATGGNDFFFLTHTQIQEFGIPTEFLVPAIGRTRDVSGDEINAERLRALEVSGRPTWLFSPDGRPLESFPKAVRDYLRKGEESGLPKRALIATRNPWYKMEVRSSPPPILFSYLGRRNCRFVRNRAGIVPLTGFLCVYPLDPSPQGVEKLWRVLQDPKTTANLPLVGKSYGSGAVKVEPRALERLPLPRDLVEREGLQATPRLQQIDLVLA